MNCLHRIAAAAVLTMASAIAVAAQSPSQIFQQALSKERADGRIEEAIQLYQRVVSDAGADRALAARALLQLGRCYEKLGEARARESYERLVRDYPEQAQPVADARVRLAELTRDAGAPARTAMAVRELPIAGPGNDLHSISPDGTRAIVGEFSRGQNIALFDFATRQSKLLTTLDWSQSWTTGGAWSPDGREVAYMQAGFKRDSIAELRVANLAGESRTIYRNESAPGGIVSPAAWAPDGKRILVTLQRADKTSAIGLVSVADGTFAPLRSFSWASPDAPSLSPDGRFVAFVERVAGLGDIHVLSIDGRQAFKAIEHPANDREPRWSPDGRHLAFLSDRLGGEALWAVAMDGGEPRGEPVKLKDGMQGVRLLEWSPRGIGALQRLDSWDVYTIAMDPASRRSIAAPRAIRYERTGHNISPVFSPDGQQLAFVSTAPTESRKRYLVVMTQPNGPAREFLIPTTEYDFPTSPYDVRWFGNGKGLGFSGTDAKGAPVVFRLTLATGEWKTYPLPIKSWTRIEWNDDGTTVYYARQGFAQADAGIFERQLDSQRERQVHALPAGGSARALEFSPDRQWLAFQQTAFEKDGQATTAIVAVKVASGDSRGLASVTARPEPGAPGIQLSGWSPDGAVVVLRSPGGRAPATWETVALDGAPRPLHAAIPSSGGTSGQPPSTPVAKWSHDGSTMVFVQTGTSGGAFILENPLAGMPRGTAASRRQVP